MNFLRVWENSKRVGLLPTQHFVILAEKYRAAREIYPLYIENSYYLVVSVCVCNFNDIEFTFLLERELNVL